MKPHSKRRGMLSLAASGLALALAGCGAVQPAATQMLSDVPMEHVHELVPDGEHLLIATHDGLYRLTIDGEESGQLAGPVGGHVFDPMGLTVVEDALYASGHPGPNSPATFGSPNLGLIRSDDGGGNWTNVSLTGKTDFHALTGVRDGSTTRLFGLPSDGAALQISDDAGATWRNGAVLGARDVMASEGALFATTVDGLLVSRDAGLTFAPEPNTPHLYLIAAAEGGMAGVDVDGVIWTRLPGGDWLRGGLTSGTPEALGFDGVRLFVADDRGVIMTDDAGATWSGFAS